MVPIGRRLGGTKRYGVGWCIEIGGLGGNRWYQDIGGWVVPRDRRLRGAKNRRLGGTHRLGGTKR